MNKPQILLVEDDEDTRVVLRHALASEGYLIREAGDGKTAIDCISQELPDLIITDIMMPGMGGLELIEWCRKEIKNSFIPILILTARTDVEEKVKGLALGADDYLCKPLSHRELRARVQAQLRIKTLTEKLSLRSKELEELNRQLAKMQEELIAKERQIVAAQLAGAAAHNLGQPLTTILLHCRILEKTLATNLRSEKERSEALRSLEKIKGECRAISDLLGSLRGADSSRTEPYPGSTTILDIKDKN